MPPWLRRASVADRYDCSTKNVDRLPTPKPKYPFGNNIPAWDEAELDAHDRSAPSEPPDSDRLPQKVAAVHSARAALARVRRSDVIRKLPEEVLEANEQAVTPKTRLSEPGGKSSPDF
jgi:hypothetical protein